MKHLQKQLLLEQIIYLSIWVLILGTPLIGFLLDNDHPLEGSELWKEVSDTWLMVLPFFLLFLIHNYVLIPRLLLKKYYTRYVLSLILPSVSCFCIFRDVYKCSILTRDSVSIKSLSCRIRPSICPTCSIFPYFRPMRKKYIRYARCIRLFC